MSVKDLKIYYNQVSEQYNEMVENLQELEEYAKTNIVEPERIDRVKETLQPIKDNYLTLSYIMFLLNKPNKKEKQKKYEKQNQKLLNSIPQENTKQGLLDKGEETLAELNKIIK